MTASFEQVQKQLADEFIGGASDLETDQELGAAFLDFVLQRERLRRGVEVPGPEQVEVDRETVDRLYHQTELSHEHHFAESIFKRLANDPTSAIRHFREAVEARSALQSHRARKTRRSRYGSITRLINDIVRDEPNIATKAVLKELLLVEGIILIDGQIRNTQDGDCMDEQNLASRVSDARKRFKKNSG